uniref:Uncharacterized protein n=1 Tax=uncultured marine virus TaxID=186617 RepID=A0A0F7L4I7_9VIRU|nr:hypothetical protein [uncultured marine virus]
MYSSLTLVPLGNSLFQGSLVPVNTSMSYLLVNLRIGSPSYSLMMTPSLVKREAVLLSS